MHTQQAYLTYADWPDLHCGRMTLADCRDTLAAEADLACPWLHLSCGWVLVAYTKVLHGSASSGHVGGWQIMQSIWTGIAGAPSWLIAELPGSRGESCPH